MPFGGKNSEQTQQSAPWGAAQPALRKVIANAQSAMNNGSLVPKPAPFSAETLQSFDAMKTAANGQITGQASDALTAMLNGSGQAEVEDSIMATVMPQVAGMFGQGGFANSTTAQGVAAKEAARALAPLKYDSKFQAISMAPTIQGMGFKDASALGLIGAQKDARRNQVNASQGQNLQMAANILGGIGGLGGTTTGSQSPSALQTIGGLGQLGTNAALAFGMLCDRRLKRDIEEVGMWKGVKLYVFRYFFDDELRIGPMADEVPERARIVLPTGFLAVNMGAL